MLTPHVTRLLSVSNETRYLRITFVLVLSLLTGLMFYAVGDGKFYPNHEDEAIYYGSAKLFAATNSFKAQSCSHEDISPVGGFNWYGPGFHPIYGSLFKIFGTHPTAFIWFHFALALITLGTIFFLPLNVNDRWIIALCLLMSHQLYFYIFTYFPETLMLFFATVLTVLLYCGFQATDLRDRKRFELIFVLCCLVFCLFRITMVFWLAGWIALAKTRAGYILRTLFFFVAVVLSLLYTKYFLAAALDSTFKAIEYLFQGDVWNFVLESFDVFFNNLGALLISDSLTLHVTNLFIVGLLISYIITRKKIFLPPILIVCSIMAVYLAYYNVKSFFLVKQTAMFIPLIFVFFIAGYERRWVKYSLVVILIALLPRTFIHSRKMAKSHRQAYENYNDFRALETAFAQIPMHIREKESTILWCYTEYDFGRHTEALLPFATRNNKPLLYTSNILEANANTEDKFKRYNKLDVHYYLSRYPLDHPFLKEILVTPYYHLYEVAK